MKKVILSMVFMVLSFSLLSYANDEIPITPQPAPRHPVLLVKWLADREQIKDLMLSYAAAIDARPVDGVALQENFVDGGYAIVANPVTMEPLRMDKEDMPELASSLNAFEATQHFMGNMLIRISGDSATARVYLTTSVIPTIPVHWDGGGWYDCTFVRTNSGWKIFSAILNVIWAGPSIESLGP